MPHGYTWNLYPPDTNIAMLLKPWPIETDDQNDDLTV